MSVINFYSIIIFAFIIILNTTYSRELDYYWREYTGIIPDDAVVGGRDINGQEVYIGQAYVNGGLMVAQITPGVMEVSVPYKGVKKIKRNIKILCGKLQDFAWLKTNASSFHVTMLGKTPVIGGHEEGLGNIHVGRIYYEGGTRIGKINSFFVGNANFRFVDSYDHEPVVKTYEALVYSKNASE